MSVGSVGFVKMKKNIDEMFADVCIICMQSKGAVR